MLESFQYEESKLKSSTVTEDLGAEPLLLPYSKQWLKIEHDADDDVINNLIKAVRQQCSLILNLDLKKITRVSEFYDLQPVSELPYGPHGNVTEVKMIDKDGNETVLTAGTDYRVLGFIYKSIQLFSRTYSSTLQVTHESGYVAATIPEPLRFLMLRTMADNYENRESIIKGSIASVLPADALKIAAQFNRKNWF